MPPPRLENSVTRRGHIRFWLPMVVLAALVGACSPAASSEPPGSASAPGGGEATDGGPGAVGNLCDAFTEDLAVAALGEPVAEPQSGEVVPRPNGIYCHYASAADANRNVEAQLKEMTGAEFDELVATLGLTDPLGGVGEAAFTLDHSTMGGAGASVAAFGGGRGVTVILNGEGDSSDQLLAVAAIAEATLASGE